VFGIGILSQVAKNAKNSRRNNNLTDKEQQKIQYGRNSRGVSNRGGANNSIHTRNITDKQQQPDAGYSEVCNRREACNSTHTKNITDKQQQQGR
jgi:hypothetical protein